MSLELPQTFPGGCHCRQVRFRLTLRSPRILDCNCSICLMKGYLHAIVPREDFELVQGEDALSTYTFNSGIAQHHFCAHCGIHPFYIPRSHPDQVDVNIRCLDQNILPHVTIEPFDGAHWEQHVHKIR